MQETSMNHELVSALVDGQLRGDEFARTVDWLGAAPDAQDSWRAYHLVGEVLRSGEVAVSRGESEFLQRLRLNLAQETVEKKGPTAPIAAVVLPSFAKSEVPDRSLAPSANEAGWRWKLIAGVASMVAVVTMGWHIASGFSPDPTRGAQLAETALPVKDSVSPLPSPPVLADTNAAPPVMIRDPQLDALLAAHRQFGGTSALQMPAGFLRNATFEGVAR